jgi:PAS domain-containing protein
MGRRFLTPAPSFADNRLMSDGRLRYRRGLPPFPRTKFPALISQLGYSNLKLAKAMSEQPRIEAALRLSEKYFRQLTRPSPVPFAIINLRGEVEYLNDRLIATFGDLVKNLFPLPRWEGIKGRGKITHRRY